jgi:hypothetical protein
VDAITLAIKEGITRDVKIGQGNGMWGLHNIVRSNSGILTITSDGGGYSIRGDQARTFHAIPTFSLELGATCVDFQIDSTKGISIADSLGGHTPVSLRLEGFENEHGDIVYRLSEQCSGTGTRDAGKRIRNEVINLHNDTRSPVELDFSGVSVVSSSFADELIGKLVAEYGFFSFNQIFRLRGMNVTVQSIMNRSVSQRMAATL